MVVCFGLPVFFEGAVYNAAALACDGRLLGFVAKQHLAGDGIHYEPRWFSRWPPGEVGEIEIAGEAYPLGDLLFDCGGVRIGFEICGDAWVADRPGARLAQRGVDILLNPSASHFAFGKQEIRERFVLEGSRAFCVSYVYANLLGNEVGPGDLRRRHADRQRRQDARRGPRFSFADWVLTTALVDVTATRRARTAFYEKSDLVECQRRRLRRSAPNFDWPEGGGEQVDGSLRRRQARACPGIPNGKPARIRRKKNSPARCRWRCSTTCARATPGSSSSRSAAGPIRRRSR